MLHESWNKESVLQYQQAEDNEEPLLYAKGASDFQTKALEELKMLYQRSSVESAYAVIDAIEIIKNLKAD